jgi:hypothetical protein
VVSLPVWIAGATPSGVAASRNLPFEVAVSELHTVDDTSKVGVAMAIIFAETVNLLTNPTILG